MPPMRFHNYSANTLSSFTIFNQLPQELRLMIWDFATNVPRIVHLTTTRLKRDDDPDWWRHVRSDKPIDGEDPEFYDNFDVSDAEIWRIEREIACQRLLTNDDDYKGVLTRAEAKVTLERVAREEAQPWRHRPRHKCPLKKLSGLRSESAIPAVLLATRESHYVASSACTRSFASPGALPQTYFNFNLDTLYLDKSTVFSILHFDDALNQYFISDELAQVKHLAISWDRDMTYIIRDDDEIFVDWLHCFERACPNLKSLTIVEDHFTRDSTHECLSGDKYRNLKFVDSTVDWIGQTYSYRINGYRIDGSFRRPAHPTELFGKTWNRQAAEDWAMFYPDKRLWQLPEPKVKSLITEHDEKSLLEDALAFEKKHNRGTWYINPRDPTDFEDFPWDDIDDDFEGLLDI